MQIAQYEAIIVDSLCKRDFLSICVSILQFRLIIVVFTLQFHKTEKGLIEVFVPGLKFQ